jgi:hypothetical protein
VESNSRLTASTGAVLFFLLAAEGITILRVGGLLSAHVFIGMLLIPPAILKIASTGWRFARYYAGVEVYRRKGPPPLVLRLLGPVVVVLTVIVLASGVALIFWPQSRDSLLTVHKVSFILWFGAMAIHVVGHLMETARTAPADWTPGRAPSVTGVGARRSLLVGSVVIGCLLGGLMLGPTSSYRSHHQFRFKDGVSGAHYHLGRWP